MPTYGGSCCDFCGCEICCGAYSDPDVRYKLRLEDSVFLSWLVSGEILDKRGKIHDHLSNETIHVMMDANKGFKKYTNIKTHWIDDKDYFEGVFLHPFCRLFIEKRTLWNRKQIFKILRTKRQPYIVHDQQACMFHSMRHEGVPFWRAINPRLNEENRDWFSNRLQELKEHAELFFNFG